MDFKNIAERNKQAFETINSSNLSDDEKKVIINSLNDVKYNLCGKEGEKDGIIMGRLIEDYFNNSCCDAKSLSKYLCNNMHRYLQSEFAKFVLMYIKENAQKEDWEMDGRNEYYMKIFKSIMQNCPDYFEYIRTNRDIEKEVAY